MKILVLEEQKIAGWPENDDDRVGLAETAEVLTGRYKTDAHFTAYTCAVERRHTNASIADPAHAKAAGIDMVLAVFDVDGPGHEGSEEWWSEEKVKLGALRTRHPGGFFYRTRGGYRIVYALPVSWHIQNPADAEQWSLRYLAWCNYLGRVFDIQADRTCKNWSRLFRVPHGTREGVPQELETFGNARDIGPLEPWEPELEEQDRVAIQVAIQAATQVATQVTTPAANPSPDRKVAAAMLGAAWPSTGRHGAQLALAGALRRDGWSKEAALEFLCDVCRAAGNEERSKRQATVERTWSEKGNLTGWTTLEQHVPPHVVVRARDLLRPDAKDSDEFLRVAAGTTAGAEPAQPELTPAERARRIGGDQTARLKTGLPTIDKITRGGLPLKKFGVIGGAPGAGKTALLCRLAATWLSQNVSVGILASDEEADALLIRLGQLQGIARDDLENGTPEARDKLASWCEGVPLLLMDGDDEHATIEAASRKLKTYASGQPSVLLVDSMQTARTGSDLPKGADIRTRVNDAVRVLKRAAKVDGHLVLASSELSKAAYRSKAQADNINALSAFKESGDIEYGVAFAMVLVSTAGNSDLVETSVVKNRLGAGKPAFILKLDHARADVTEADQGEVEIRDPKHFLKCEIMEIVTDHGPLGRTTIALKAGGRKTEALRAIDELVDAHRLTEAPEGIRLPLPGEPGYKEEL